VAKNSSVSHGATRIHQRSAHVVLSAEHLQMQAAIQSYVDQAISKTINIPADYDFDTFRNLYQDAYDLGLKGCTTFWSNPITGVILSKTEMDHTALHCCSLEREAD